MAEENNNQDLFEHYKVVADKGQGQLRVDKFLMNHLENISRNKLQDAAANGSLHVNGKPVKANYKVKPLDEVTLMMPEPKKELTIIAEDIPLDILYEDETLLVINKPAGLVVHPGHGNYSGTMVNALAYHLKDNPVFQQNDPRPGLVHRIDKDTSGILVVAKEESAKFFLAKQFAQKTAERKYVAVAWGTPKEPEGTITGYIGRSLKDRKVMHIYPDDTHGKWAVTNYKVLEDLGYVSVVECVLETGRTHQIRAHFKYLGHPLFNDSTYGGDKILRGTTHTKYKQYIQNCFELCNRQALHAKVLGFIHPKTKELMRFEVDMPSDMSQLIDKWRNYIAHR